jgi:hypothetical protein
MAEMLHADSRSVSFLLPSPQRLYVQFLGTTTAISVRDDATVRQVIQEWCVKRPGSPTLAALVDMGMLVRAASGRTLKLSSPVDCLLEVGALRVPLPAFACRGH